MTMAVKACVWPKWRVDSDGTTVSEIPGWNCPVASLSKNSESRSKPAKDRAACIGHSLSHESLLQTRMQVWPLVPGTQLNCVRDPVRQQRSPILLQPINQLDFESIDLITLLKKTPSKRSFSGLIPLSRDITKMAFTMV